MLPVQIAEGATPTLIAAAGRKGQDLFYNASDTVIWLALDGDSEVVAGEGIPINPGDRFFHEPPIGGGRAYAPAIYGVHAGSGDKRINYGNTARLFHAEA